RRRLRVFLASTPNSINVCFNGIFGVFRAVGTIIQFGSHPTLLGKKWARYEPPSQRAVCNVELLASLPGRETLLAVDLPGSFVLLRLHSLSVYSRAEKVLVGDFLAWPLAARQPRPFARQVAGRVEFRPSEPESAGSFRRRPG